MYMYIYIYIYVCMYVYIYLCIYVYIYIFMCICIYIYVYVSISDIYKCIYKVLSTTYWYIIFSRKQRISHFLYFMFFCRLRMGMQADSLVNVPRRSAGCLADEFQLLGFTTYVIFPKEIPLLGNLYKINVSKAIVNHPQFYHAWVV